MKGLIVFITVIVAVKSAPTNKKALIEDLKFHCDSLCSTNDGIFEFNEKQKICICHVGKYFDEMETTLMRKNAQAVGMHLKTVKSPPKILSKRDSSEPKHSTTEPTKKKSLFPEKKPFLFNNPKEKQSTSKFQLKAPKIDDSPTGHHDAFVGARAVTINSRARPLQHSATKDVWLKARQRLDHLIKHSDGGKFNSRFAASETQAIRNALKPLTLKTKPLSGHGRSAGGLPNAKHGGGFNRNSLPLKVTGNLKRLKPNVGKINGLFGNSNGQIKPRMNSQRLVGASGPSENGDGNPNEMSSTAELGPLNSDVEKSSKVAVASKRLGKKDGKVKHVVVQPPNTIQSEED